ncbi:MAG: hypothetical protein JSV73_05100 [Flavobacteriaceae bacterium]|nr:MAG: hypothetical protein JSV73_05100 [Flavobacteriaceae bacterium]
MRKLALMLVFFLIYNASSLKAKSTQTFVSGEQLLQECSAVFTSRSTHSEMLNESKCFSYIKGSFDFHQCLVKSNTIKPQFCKPYDVTLGEMIMAVIKYLKENPEKKDLTASSIVSLALNEAFPCSEPEPDEFKALFEKKSKNQKKQTGDVTD